MDQNNIFISYRRVDSEGYAERIYDRLQACFGLDRVFMDVTNIGVAENFVDAINQAISSCRVVIVLIGPRWHSIKDEMGRKRLDDPHDFVRVEVQAALDQGVLIVPVLVNGAKMPKPGTLPQNMRSMLDRNAIEIRHRRFDADVKYLIAEIELYLGKIADESSTVADRKSSWPLHNWGWMVFTLFSIGILSLVVWWSSKINLTTISTQPTVASTDTAFAALDKRFIHTLTLQPLTETATATPSVTASSTVTHGPTLSSTPIPTSTSTDAFLPTQIVDPFGVSMVLVPQGPFIMGTDGREPWDLVARPARMVGLDMFYIDKYEVSNAQYAECVSAGACQAPLIDRSKMRRSYFDNPQFTEYPVVYVSWDDARMFCAWRGGRLPFEAEWEKAARGDEQFSYPWGDTPVDCQHANYWPAEACEGDTLPVSSLIAGSSPYGVMNMSGNVQEWVYDWFQAYPGGDPNATKEFGISHRVIRGGAYFDGSNNIRATTRNGLNPKTAHSYVGFRCVMDIEALP